MPHRLRWGFILLLASCTRALPPAVPEDRAVFEPPLVATQLPAPEPLADVPVTSMPRLQPSLDELQAFVVPRPPGKVERPEKVIDDANAGARVSPTRQGYADGKSAVQRYPYLPGRIYDIYLAPNAPTTIFLPVGERLAATPTLNPDAWDVGVAEMGEGPTHQEAIILRPVAAGQDGTTPLLTRSGKVFFCRLRSFETTAMIAVAWEMPSVKLLNLTGQERAPHTMRAPTIDVSRLHMAYRIEPSKGGTAFTPVSVYDDGQRTVLRFQEALSYTKAPGVFASHGDGSPGVVQFSTYEVPGSPDKGFFYLIDGLWPRLELKGSDGAVVTITRQPTQPPPFTEMR